MIARYLQKIMQQTKLTDFLFSLDLEDVRDRIPNGTRYAARVPELTHRILNFLDKYNAKITFFVVGQTARAFPELVSEIVLRGHEIACHSDKHITLDNMTPQEFESDLRRNLDTFAGLGVYSVLGYRAPTLSLTQATQWVYPALKKHGIIYSSSVNSSRSPLHGWRGFGTVPRKIGEIIEIPISQMDLILGSVPACSGTYLRIIPAFISEQFFWRQIEKTSVPVVSYIHPYDIDEEQEHFMHPELGGSRFLNSLMYLNRKSVLPKLERIMSTRNVRMITYSEYVSCFLNSLPK